MAVAELLRRTSLTEDEIGEYSGQVKEVKPVTIATYQILTARRKGEYAHLALLDALDWGLVIYDEVHLLPAPVFKLTSCNAGDASASPPPSHEDGREGDVFSLIGPKTFSTRRGRRSRRRASSPILLRGAHRPAAAGAARICGIRG